MTVSIFSFSGREGKSRIHSSPVFPRLCCKPVVNAFLGPRGACFGPANWNSQSYSYKTGSCRRSLGKCAPSFARHCAPPVHGLFPLNKGHHTKLSSSCHLTLHIPRPGTSDPFQTFPFKVVSRSTLKATLFFPMFSLPKKEGEFYGGRDPVCLICQADLADVLNKYWLKESCYFKGLQVTTAWLQVSCERSKMCLQAQFLHWDGLLGSLAAWG